MGEIHKNCIEFLCIFFGKEELTFLKKVFIMEEHSEDNSFIFVSLICVIRYADSDKRKLSF